VLPTLLAGLLLGGCSLVQSAPGSGSACPGAVPWDQAGRYLGQRITVRGPVVASHYAEDGDGQPTLLDVGKPYPDPGRFTVVIWGRDRAAFPNPPEQAYRSRTVCVTGLVDTAMGSPGIEVTSPAAIVLP
jgi:hypothetical protein